jgi:hypothetical protein
MFPLRLDIRARILLLDALCTFVIEFQHGHGSILRRTNTEAMDGRPRAGGTPPCHTVA